MRLRSSLLLLAALLVLGGFFYIDSRPKPQPPANPQFFVWMIDAEDLQHIKIELPREGISQSFVVHDDRYWYFDDPPGPQVDIQRWGGGITLLLSGPGANRIISRNSSEEQLTKFGLTQPQMLITLNLKDGTDMIIKVGDRTPDGANFYVQAPGSNDVALVDYTWYQVLERLVKDPPYPQPTS